MFFTYLKRHVKIILLLALFAAIFAAVFSLYSLPTEAVLYSAALCLAAGAAFFGFSYLRYARRRRELLALRRRIATAADALPPPSGGFDEEYQALLRLLHAELARVETESETERRDMTDYYTLWAHQIKTPIAAMRLLLQSEDGAQNTALAIELMRVEQYVEMVLGYLRLGSETTDYVLREYALDDIIRQAVRKYAPVFISKKLTLDLADTGLRVMTDEKWLLFVIEQLLSNALKYTFSGGISISAAGFVLSLRDSGIGIRPEDLPRVFENGFTGFNGRSDKKSTGIGLYLCKRVCGKLGHGLSIESAPGLGTCVRLDLTPSARVVE